MIIEIALGAGIAAATLGIGSLLKPLIWYYLEKKQESITVSITTENGDTKLLELHGENGGVAIEKILNSLR